MRSLQSPRSPRGVRTALWPDMSSGTDANQVGLYAFEFIPDEGWFSISGCSPIQIQSTGQFTVNATTGIMGRYATRFSAYLVPISLSVPCVQSSATIPFIYQQNALSTATVPRIPQYTTLNFGGLTWFVKTAPVQVYPGAPVFQSSPTPSLMAWVNFTSGLPSVEALGVPRKFSRHKQWDTAPIHLRLIPNSTISIRM